MTKTITIQSVESKIAKTGTPWLAIKDTQGNSYSVWEQIIFHMFKPGATLDVDCTVKGKYTNITGIAGQTPAQPAPLGKPTAWSPELVEKIFESQRLLHAKIDKIGKMVAELAPAMEDDIAANVPPLQDEEIKPEEIPF